MQKYGVTIVKKIMSILDLHEDHDKMNIIILGTEYMGILVMMLFSSRPSFKK